MNLKPKNSLIEISEFENERSFVSGNKYYYLDWAKFKDVSFKAGDKVEWEDEYTGKLFKGKIDWIIIIDDGSVEVSIKNSSYGRIPLQQLTLIK